MYTFLSIAFFLTCDKGNKEVVNIAKLGNITNNEKL